MTPLNCKEGFPLKDSQNNSRCHSKLQGRNVSKSFYSLKTLNLLASRGSRSQISFKTGDIENSGTFTGKPSVGVSF